jgi:hypothetical protein
LSKLALLTPVLVVEFLENINQGGMLPIELGENIDFRTIRMEDGTIDGQLPSEWGELEFLRILDLNFQQLDGPIPDTYYDLTKLNQLDLNDNELTGSVSENIGNLENLQFFEVGNNNLGGLFPQSLGELSSLCKWVTFVRHIVLCCGIVICHLAPILYLTLVLPCNHLQPVLVCSQTISLALFLVRLQAATSLNYFYKITN